MSNRTVKYIIMIYLVYLVDLYPQDNINYTCTQYLILTSTKKIM